MKAISIKPSIGLGDTVQFSSVPENYFRETGECLLDIGKSWIFDHNPYVIREPNLSWDDALLKWGIKNEEVIELWDYALKPSPPSPHGHQIYLSLAERHATVLGVPCVMKYPRLYRFENFPFEKREMILLHTHGKSHGAMPEHVIKHVLTKYKKMPLYHIGLPTDPDLGIPRITPSTFWDLAEVISKSRIYIGVDSGPSWVACCYPDVQVKKIRLKPDVSKFKTWIPQEVCNIHSHWDDRIFTSYNTSEDDVGFTSSYRRL